MKAMQITAYDGLNGLRYEEVPTPEPGPGQVAIDVHYAGANYVEALFSQGLMPLPLPWVPGLEAAGTIRSVGEGVDGFMPGQWVAAFVSNASGGYGQVTALDTHLVARLPQGLDPVIAAATPSNTTAALIAIERIGQMPQGAHVLVHGAAGGLGSQLGQVAKLLGAGRVVGVVGSEAKRDIAMRLGYDEVWLRAEVATQEASQFDLIADPVSGPTRLQSLNLLKLGGVLLALGDAAQAGDQLISSNQLWFNGIGVKGFNMGAFIGSQPAVFNTYLNRALELVASGDLKVIVDQQAPIQEAPRVLSELMSGQTVGKTVFVHEGAAA